MTDDLVRRLREKAFRAESCEMLETAADRIEKLEAALVELVRTFNNMMRDAVRIEKLEAALQEIAWIATPDHEEARQKATEIARKALEGKDD